MIKIKCPICSKALEIAKIEDLPSFPFCSTRCRTIDLGRWASGNYTIADKGADLYESAPPSGDPQSLDDDD